MGQCVSSTKFTCEENTRPISWRHKDYHTQKMDDKKHKVSCYAIIKEQHWLKIRRNSRLVENSEEFKFKVDVYSEYIHKSKSKQLIIQLNPPSLNEELKRWSY
ncbi:hypothetical protein H5410_013987 [Solanum commersonii]|uniref:Uncharacterized protein n=1 Tax=Solanum commersonii TaxID=4109 RepID=A0A9J5ZPY0_SOLCO|nr:hypothetical protein H5410_013987 [Solanum commersonii]